MIRNDRPHLLLHTCCGICLIPAVRELSPSYSIIPFFFNPNIMPEDEWKRRKEVVERVIFHFSQEVSEGLLEGAYTPSIFLEETKGLENEREGGRRCMVCFRLRLRQSAATAKIYGIRLFSTTLSASPMKKVELINQIGEECAMSEGVEFLPLNLKKKGGFQYGAKVSRELGLYRQNYCGCLFSMKR